MAVSKDETFDIIIIGGGPVGLFAAFYAGLRDMKTKIIESLPDLGGQLTVLYPEKLIYDVAGFPRILAKDLVKSLVEQGLYFKPAVHLDEQAQSLDPVDGEDSRIWRIGTNRGKHFTRTLLITAGIGAFAPNRLANPSIAHFERRGVYYLVKDKTEFRGKRLLIIGGGDTAVDWALNLKDLARKVTLIHRREQFRAHEGSVASLMNSEVEVKLFYELKEVRGNEHVEEATIFDNRNSKEETLAVDAVIINIGYKADLGPLREWGMELENRRIVVNGRMETSLPGVYAAGDIASPKGSVYLNLIATGFGQATVAVNIAKNYIDPKARVFPGHSSEMRL